ncbi:MAG: 30S ribosomal protein S2 [Candidatus Sungbacteria bacterium]|nr:30S ribosomal protein S2 [Candidatus Sungbacteria bacterium]
MSTTVIEGENKSIIAAEDHELQAMIDAGVHLGHSKNKRHPAMEPYIWTVRGSTSIIDLTKTKELFQQALEFLKSVAAKGELVLLIGTRPAARDIISETARSLGMPYASERWVGGTLTNFKVISKRVEMLIDLEKKRVEGEFEKYTKKERLGFEKEIERLKRDFDGLRVMNRLPAAVFITNVPHELTAVREALRMKIPIVALTDTNANPDLISFPVPSNDDAKSVIRYWLERVQQAIQDGRNEGLKRQNENSDSNHDLH